MQCEINNSSSNTKSQFCFYFHFARVPLFLSLSLYLERFHSFYLALVRWMNTNHSISNQRARAGQTIVTVTLVLKIIFSWHLIFVCCLEFPMFLIHQSILLSPFHSFFSSRSPFEINNRFNWRQEFFDHFISLAAEKECVSFFYPNCNGMQEERARVGNR